MATRRRPLRDARRPKCPYCTPPELAARAPFSTPPPPTSAPPRSSVVEARHELRLSSRLMQRLRALVPDLPWTTGNLHMEQAIRIPSVDRRLNNESLLLQVCGLLPKHQGPGLVRNTPPPCRTELCGYDHAPVTRGRMRAQFPLPHATPLAEATLQVVLFSDGYDPRGRSNYNVKVAILDLVGQLFHPVEGVPSATSLLTWRELDWAAWAVNGRSQEIKKMQATTFRLSVVVAGTCHVVQLRLQ